MARIGRNQPCPCGSGKKAKRCCAISRGPSEEDLNRAFMAGQRADALSLLACCSRQEIEGLVDDLFVLPACDLSLVAPLPPILTPELDRLARVISDKVDDEVDDALEAAMPAIDTIAVRTRLARAVIALRDAGRVSERLAALALFDLADRSVDLLRCALIQAMAIATGRERTPSGLVVASR